MKAKIVVDLGFGDSGKGITTDYLARELDSSIVVRYSGGHQASHHVVVGDIGIEHTFSSYCSGTLRDKQSYISEHCCIYPPYINMERNVLYSKLKYYPRLTIHPLAKLTTPYDLAYNRMCEMHDKHGSVGVGIGKTMERQQGPYKIHAVDLLHEGILKQKMDQVRNYYRPKIWEFNSKDIKFYDETVALEMKMFNLAIQSMHFYIDSYGYLNNFENVIFEGAQGILLDMVHGIFPNVTYGHTSSRNAISICKELGISNIEMFYVTRCYSTRHGNGWMPNEIPVALINNAKEINIPNEWQGSMRTGELSYELLNYSLTSDDAYSYGNDKFLVVTCLDQRPDFKFNHHHLDYLIKGIITSHSPDSKDFKIV